MSHYLPYAAHDTPPLYGSVDVTAPDGRTYSMEVSTADGIKAEAAGLPVCWVIETKTERMEQ